MRALPWGAVLAGILAAGCSDGGAGLARGGTLPVPEGALAQPYQQHCQMCHGRGVAGAPRVGSAEAWASRATQGLATLTAHVVQGIAPAMPARGGCLQCDDATLEALVAWMIGASLPTEQRSKEEG